MADSFDVSILDYAGRKSKRRRKKDELLDIPESPSLLGRAGGAALSGLAAVGNVLDTPGSMVRDLLAGENPIDQLAAPWRSDNRLSGRDLLRKHGLVGSKDTWGNWLGGFGVELATDPLTYLTGGITKGGQVAAKAGISGTDDVLRVAGKSAGAGADNWITAAGKAATLVGKRKAFRSTSAADLLRGAGEQAGSLNDAFDVAARTSFPGIDDAAIAALKKEKLSTGGIGFKIPFGPKFELANTKTPLVGKLLEGGADVLDLAGDAIKYGKYSPIRPLVPVFDKAVRGAMTKVGQVFGRQADTAAREGEVAARGAMAPALEAFEKSDLFNADKLVKGGMSLPDANKQIAGHVNELLRYTEGLADDLPDALKPLKGHLDTIKGELAQSLASRQAIGLPGANLRDMFAEYFPRQKHFFDPGLRQAAGRAAAAFPTAGGAQMAREDILKDLPGATAVINEISLDPKISGKAWAHDTADPLVNFQNKNPFVDKETVSDAMKHIVTNYPDALKPAEDSLTGKVLTLLKKHGDDPQGVIEELARDSSQYDGQELLAAANDWLSVKGEPITPKNVEKAVAKILKDDALRSELKPLDNSALDLVKHTVSEGDDIGEAMLNIHRNEMRGLGLYLQAGGSWDDISKKLDAKSLKSLAKEALHFDPRHVREGMPLYGGNMVEGSLNHLTSTAKHLASGQAVHDLIAASANVGDAGEIPLGKALERAGLTGENAASYSLGKLRSEPRFKPIFKELIQEFQDMAGEGGGPTLTEFLMDKVTVPAEAVKESERLMKAFSAPGEVNALVEVADKVQRLFKSGVTSIFPSFHVRNFMSGLFQNWVIDAGDPRFADPIRRFYMPIKDMDELLKGNVLKDAVEIPFIQKMGITDAAQASQILRREIFKHNVIGQSAVDDAGDMLAPLSQQMPGLRPETLSFRNPIKSTATVGKTAFPKSLRQANPFNVAGVASEADEFAPVAAGRMVGNYTEKINRGSGFLGLLRQGFSPAEAAKKIRSAQVDYGNLTNTEKTIFRRVAPFYSFSKGAGEFVVNELTKDPAGRLGKVVRAARMSHNPDEMTPDYVAESAAIPLGEAQDGTKRYVTGLGLPFEDPLSFLGGGLRGAGLEALSRGNPLLKGPLEWATGQSFFQKGPEGGRPLEDLDPTIGRTIANLTGSDRPVTFPGSQAMEAVLGNSPLSRALTSARQLSDPRKGVGAKAANLLTGVRVADVSPAVQDSLLREQAQKILKSYPEARTYTQTFVPKDEWAKLAPDERLKVQELTTILNVLSKRAQRRAEQKKALATGKK